MGIQEHIYILFSSRFSYIALMILSTNIQHYSILPGLNETINIVYNFIRLLPKPKTRLVYMKNLGKCHNDNFLLPIQLK